ncbi:MAG: hypothetical protein HPZ91_02255 [Lentisphaeria bacterium]|nr:hypothetical protein [Lentisphaeria bacterium]
MKERGMTDRLPFELPREAARRERTGLRERRRAYRAARKALARQPWISGNDIPRGIEYREGAGLLDIRHRRRLWANETACDILFVVSLLLLPSGAWFLPLGPPGYRVMAVVGTAGLTVVFWGCFGLWLGLWRIRLFDYAGKLTWGVKTKIVSVSMAETGPSVCCGSSVDGVTVKHEMSFPGARREVRIWIAQKVKPLLDAHPAAALPEEIPPFSGEITLEFSKWLRWPGTVLFSLAVLALPVWFSVWFRQKAGGDAALLAVGLSGAVSFGALLCVGVHMNWKEYCRRRSFSRFRTLTLLPSGWRFDGEESLFLPAGEMLELVFGRRSGSEMVACLCLSNGELRVIPVRYFKKWTLVQPAMNYWNRHCLRLLHRIDPGAESAKLPFAPHSRAAAEGSYRARWGLLRCGVTACVLFFLFPEVFKWLGLSPDRDIRAVYLIGVAGLLAGAGAFIYLTWFDRKRIFRRFDGIEVTSGGLKLCGPEPVPVPWPELTRFRAKKIAWRPPYGGEMQTVYEFRAIRLAERGRKPQWRSLCFRSSDFLDPEGAAALLARHWEKRGSTGLKKEDDDG